MTQKTETVEVVFKVGNQTITQMHEGDDPTAAARPRARALSDALRLAIRGNAALLCNARSGRMVPMSGITTWSSRRRTSEPWRILSWRCRLLMWG